MLKLAWRGVRHSYGRYAATLVAIMTGVAFFAATGFLGDRIVDSIEGDIRRQFEPVDVAVIPKTVESNGLVVEADKLRIPQDRADAITAMDGVDAVGPVLVGNLGILDGDDVEDATGRLWIADDDLNPVAITDGAAPTASGQIAVDKGTAEDQSLAVGDSVTVRSLAGDTAATVVGITEFGNSDSLDSGGNVFLAGDDAFDFLASGRAEYDELYIRSGTDQKRLADAVQETLPEGFQAVGGDVFLKDKIDELGGFAKVLKRVLQAFAFLSIAVGAFVIYNTFSVIVTQRTQELAVLRAIGATPRQVKRSLRWEGIVVGLLGSVLGLFAGAIFVLLIDFVVSTFLGLNIPGSGLIVRSNTIIIGLLLGTLVTFFSVMIPARKAARTEPIEALRDAAVEASPFSKSRIVMAALTAGVGFLLIFTGPSLGVVAGGLALTFIAVIVGGPFLALTVSRASRPLMSKLGLEGRLAADNTGRNPGRTATTANALLIGVFLVTLVTLAGTSVKNFAVEEISKVESADFLILSDGGTLEQPFLDKVGALEGIETVSAFRRQLVAIDGVQGTVSTLDLAAVLPATDISAASGDFDDLVNGTVSVPEIPDGPVVGDTVKISVVGGPAMTFKVAVVTGSGNDGALVGSILTADDFEALAGDIAPTVAFVDANRGNLADIETGLDELADARPDLSIVNGNTIGQIIGQIFDFLINAVNGLLLMSVVVAAIGIVNTLSLSIFERRRELGLLRVVGMVDKKVERMVRLESVLIAFLGTAGGVLLGIFFSWALLFSIRRITPSAVVQFTWTPGRLIIILVGGFVLGILAALIPARRSTRLDVLDAISV